jgi:3-hydroxyisobutyrate dehydrogenase/2-hydroxy-3-oxopropionate reductase
MSEIAFLGTGAMGSRMATRLLAAGHQLTVWNRTHERTADLLAQGARGAQTPREAAEGAEFVITMLRDGRALREVADGPDGILAGLQEGARLLEMSTVGPRAVADLASALPPATAMLDAPVLGSLGEVEAGALTIFVGGTGDDFARAEPLLKALGTPLHVGPLGHGARAKLVANASLIGVLGLLGEVLSLADGLGLPRNTAFSVLAHTPLAAQAERRRAATEQDALPVRFALSLALKDAGLVSAAGAEGGRDLRLLRAAESWLRQAEEAGWGGADYASVLREILRHRDS